MPMHISVMYCIMVFCFSQDISSYMYFFPSNAINMTALSGVVSTFKFSVAYIASINASYGSSMCPFFLCALLFW